MDDLPPPLILEILNALSAEVQSINLLSPFDLPGSTTPGLGARTGTGLPPAIANADRQSSEEEAVPLGFRRVSGQAINDGSLPKQKSLATNDSTSKEAMLSSSTFLGRSSGSLRRAAVSTSREGLVAGNESDPVRSRTTETSPGTFQKISSGQRSSPFGGSSDPNRTSSGRINSGTNKYESTLKGIKSLHFEDEERVNY